MTKANWKSYIKNHLAKIDKTNRYHAIVIEKTIDTVYSQMFSEMYAKDKRGMYKYLRTYKEIILGGQAAGLAIALSNAPVVLPRINGGVFDVYYKVGDAGSSIPCELTGKDMYDRSVASTYDTLDVQGRYLASYAAGSLYVNKALSTTDAVYYTILPKFSTLSDTNEVLLPMGADEILADRVLDTMRLIPPVDLLNNNADTNG